MKIPFTIWLTAVIAMGTGNGQAVNICDNFTSTNVSDCNSTYGQKGTNTGCSKYSYICYYGAFPGWAAAVNCTECSSGYTLETGIGADGCQSIKYGQCKKNETTSDWKECPYGNTNIELKNVDNKTLYRCKAGYYHLSMHTVNSCTSSCIRCPHNGTSDPDNNSGVTSCYQKAGNHNDDTGVYTLTGTCYYKE